MTKEQYHAFFHMTINMCTRIFIFSDESRSRSCQDPQTLDLETKGVQHEPHRAAIVSSGQLPLFFENKGGPRRLSADLPRARVSILSHRPFSNFN